MKNIFKVEETDKLNCNSAFIALYNQMSFG